MRTELFLLGSGAGPLLDPRTGALLWALDDESDYGDLATGWLDGTVRPIIAASPRARRVLSAPPFEGTVTVVRECHDLPGWALLTPATAVHRLDWETTSTRTLYRGILLPSDIDRWRFAWDDAPTPAMFVLRDDEQMGPFVTSEGLSAFEAAGLVALDPLLMWSPERTVFRPERVYDRPGARAHEVMPTPDEAGVPLTFLDTGDEEDVFMRLIEVADTPKDAASWPRVVQLWLASVLCDHELANGGAAQAIGNLGGEWLELAREAAVEMGCPSEFIALLERMGEFAASGKRPYTLDEYGMEVSPELEVLEDQVGDLFSQGHEDAMVRRRDALRAAAQEKFASVLDGLGP